MKRFVVCLLSAIGISLGMAGCSEKTEVKKTSTVETPQGSTTIETTQEVTKSGENPPPANP